jgi:palmitoyltransferase
MANETAYFSNHKRQNGFSAPFSREQITVWIIYPLSTLSYFILIFYLTQEENELSDISYISDGFDILFPLHLIITGVFLSIWLVLSILDPEYTNKSKFSGVTIVCFPNQKLYSYYCPVCKKKILGLDHHCKWLNTCIGARNYLPFLLLAIVGFIQFLLQTIVASDIVSKADREASRNK